jgi:hypothetical protein
MSARRRIAGAAMLAVLAVSTCGASGIGSAEALNTASTRSRSSRPASRRVPGSSGRVVVRGAATLDGAPFDSKFVGAVVLKAGLVTPCQYTLPAVTQGRYAVTVLADAESAGCGAPGTQVVLWVSAHNEIVFSTNTVAWPRRGHTTNFAARYSTAAPAGAAPTTAQFHGGAFNADGRQLPAGTRIEAYVGSTRCGVAGLRFTDPSTEYVLAVVGPDSRTGCTRGAPLAFRIDGHPAASTSVVNTPPGQREALDLRVP